MATCESSGIANSADEQSVERERRITSDLKQRLLAAATLTGSLAVRRAGMRTTEEFRKRQIETLPLALQRPGMFCGSGQSADLYYGMILSDLCWLDERETELAAVDRQLLHGSMRVYGQFFYQHLYIPDHFGNEIASTYAQAAYRLGYYNPERVLTESEFEELKNSIDAQFLTTDHTESEIVSRFGEPTHDVLGGQTTVHCYGCCDRNANWVYFDYSRCYPPKDPHSYDWPFGH